MNITRIILSASLLLLAGIYLFYPSGKSSVAAVSSTKKTDSIISVLPEISDLQSGDLIVRHGRGFISDAFLKFSRKDSRYSHAGFIIMQNNVPFVYHAIGGEENKSNKLRKDRLNDFCNPENGSAYAVYRYNLRDEEISEIAKSAEHYYVTGLEFDLAFDLKSDSAMYCSEFIYKIITRVTGNSNYISLSSVNNTLYIAVDELFLNPNCTLLFSHRYTE